MRLNVINLPGLSFREFLNIKTGSEFEIVPFEELINKHQQIAARMSQVSTITKYFEEYLLFGYYPIVFQGRDNLYDAITNIIDKTIYEDIANFYNLKTLNLNHFKRIINFLASIPPGKVKTNNLAKHLHIDNKTADHYLDILQRTGIVKVLFLAVKGNQLLTKPAKVYLDNTTLLATANTFLSTKPDIGFMRELTFMQFIVGAGIKAFYSEIGDFNVNNIVFEIGGKNKTWQQLNSYKGKKILVKDNILVGMKNEIPLYLFGFLY